MSEITHAAVTGPTSIEQRLRTLQTATGAVFSLFVLLHLSNIALAPFGVEVFNTYQQVIRALYQYPPIEIGLVLGPLALHAIAGVGLYVLRRGQRHAGSLRQRMHRWAGAFLLLVMGGHILAVRGPSYFYGVFPEFEGLAFSLWYLPAYFYPYYFLLALAGLYHATHGLRMAGVRIHMAVVMLAAAWFALSLLALGGVLYDIEDPRTSDFARLGEALFDLDISQPW